LRSVRTQRRVEPVGLREGPKRIVEARQLHLAEAEIVEGRSAPGIKAQRARTGDHVRHPINARGLGRWRDYAEQL
jgi:hypothetical protein